MDILVTKRNRRFHEGTWRMDILVTERNRRFHEGTWRMEARDREKVQDETMQPLYTALKVNNEIELCEVQSTECKRDIERELLKNRISYYIRWPKPTLFNHKKNLCIFCINDSARETAEAVVRTLCENNGYEVRFLMKRSEKH